MIKPLILQTDFGSADGAVSAMYGVAQNVAEGIKVFDLTHEIPQYNIWEASYRLIQTVNYWPEGSVFVSVVDPGVGSARRSIAVKTTRGQYIITPDNGTLTHLKRRGDIIKAVVIDEDKHRLPGSGHNYTFHGRDIYAYNGARLASEQVTLSDLGEDFPVEDIIELPVIDPELSNGEVSGTIDVLDVRFGSLWSNIPRELFLQLGVEYGDKAEVTIIHESRTLYKNIMTFSHSFADVSIGEPLIYVNSLDNMAVAINQGSFSRAYNIGTGNSWRIAFREAPKLIYQ